MFFPNHPLTWWLRRKIRAYRRAGFSESSTRLEVGLARLHYCQGWWDRAELAQDEIRKTAHQSYKQGLKDQAENFWDQLPDNVTDSLVITELE